MFKIKNAGIYEGTTFECYLSLMFIDQTVSMVRGRKETIFSVLLLFNCPKLIKQSNTNIYNLYNIFTKSFESIYLVKVTYFIPLV